MRRRVAAIWVVCLVLTISAGGCRRGRPEECDRIFDRSTRDFAARLTVGSLRMLSVQYNGRVGPLDTLARRQVWQICGDESPQGIEPAVAYLELHFNSGHYLTRPVIYVRSRGMREFIVAHLEGGFAAAFNRTHRIPPAMLLRRDEDLVAMVEDDEALSALAEAGRMNLQELFDSMSIPSLARAWGKLAERRDLHLPWSRLRVRYSSFMALGVLRLIPSAGGCWPAAEEFLAPAPASPRPAGWQLLAHLRDAWRARDAEKVNTLVEQLARMSATNAGCPSAAIRRTELLYNKARKGHVLWIGFAVAAVLFVVAAASGLRWARRGGMMVLGLSAAGMGTGFVVRWIISARPWYLLPMMTQYEAMIASALLAALLAVVVECVWKKNYVALAASFYAAAALLCVQFVELLLPGRMDSSLGVLPGLLWSRIMVVHVAVIVIGHALAGMTFVISIVYLAAAAVRGPGDSQEAASGADLSGPAPTSVLATIDRCNLIVAQLACWMVLAGTALGALWADVAWGRWWGWDPKETWALITGLIYLSVLYVRFATPVRYRGLVTALGCVVGCGAMLFNWFAVNYLLGGLHSHA